MNPRFATDLISGYSPGWVNPRRVKLKMKPRRRVFPAADENSCPPDLASSGTAKRKASLSLGKQHNVFHRSPKKKRKTTTALSSIDLCRAYLTDENSSNALLCSLEEQDQLTAASVSTPAVPVDFSCLKSLDLGPIPFTEDLQPAPVVPNRLPMPPLDLRLSLKLRLVSQRPLPWGQTSSHQPLLTSADKARASQLAASGHLLSAAPLPTSDDLGGLKAELGAAMTYWEAPSLPWLTSFPRRLDEGGRRLLSTDPATAPPIINSPNTVLHPLRQHW